MFWSEWALRVFQVSPHQIFDLTGKHAHHLHSILSTGAVLTRPLAQWLAEAFGPVCQVSMSGGTELCGAFLHGSRSLPSYPREMAVKALGLDVAVFSADGKPLPDGESGELVCRKPFPNMPAMFWDDPGRKRYYKSYFAEFPRKFISLFEFEAEPAALTSSTARCLDARGFCSSQPRNTGHICPWAEVSLLLVALLPVATADLRLLVTEYSIHLVYVSEVPKSTTRLRRHSSPAASLMQSWSASNA